VNEVLNPHVMRPTGSNLLLHSNERISFAYSDIGRSWLAGTAQPCATLP
jgi:hypothetical protein